MHAVYRTLQSTRREDNVVYTNANFNDERDSSSEITANVSSSLRSRFQSVHQLTKNLSFFDQNILVRPFSTKKVKIKTTWSSPCAFFVAVIVVLQTFHSTYAINGGKLYVLGFFNLTGSTSYSLAKTPVFEEIAISCYQCNTIVKIRIPQLNIVKVITLSTPNNTTYKYSIAQDLATATPLPASLTWSSIGAIITSNSSAISVQVSKAVPQSSLAYLALPLYYYTTTVSSNIFNYFIASYTNVTNSAASIVAAYNDTCVEIYTRGQASATSDPQIQQSFMMQSGDVFNMYSTSADFTGWIVLARKPIGVFGGLDYAQVPVSAANFDAIMEQMPARIGTLFTLASIPGRPYSAGFRYRVMLALDVSVANPVNITEVAFDSTLKVPTIVSQRTITLLVGKYWEGVTSTSNFTIIVIVSTLEYPLEVAQYNVGSSLGNINGINSDPSMVIWPCADDGYASNALQCYTQNITFSTLSVNYGSGPVPAANYITILAYDGNQDSPHLPDRLRFDGTLIKDLPGFSGWINVGTASGITKAIKNQLYFQYHYIATVGPIADGFHTITADSPTIYDYYNAVVYGHGQDASNPTSHAFAAGWETFMDYPGRTRPFDLLTGSLSDFSDPQAVATTAAPASDITTAAASSLDQLPTFGIVWTADFSTLQTTTDSKTSSRDCSNLYAKEFVFVISNYLASAVSANLYTVIGCPSGVIVNVNVGTYEDIYYSQYTTTGGRWNMTVTGSGSATLADIYLCAQSIIVYTQNIINWRPNYDRRAQNMLQREDPNFAANFTALGDCPSLYVKNLDNKGYLPAKSSWLCTTQNSAVVSTSTSPPSAMLAHRTASLTRAIVFAVLALVLFNRWR